GFNRRLRRLKKRRCQQKNIMLSIHSLTRIGGFCFCRRGFNRRLRRLKKRRCQQKNIMLTIHSLTRLEWVLFL
ncbi:hypothetical protein, partial [Microcoleus sp. CAWBG556]